MRRAGIYLVFGVFAYLLSILFTWPAVRLEGYIEEQFQGLSLSAVSGTVFHGEAGRVRYQDVAMGSLTWRFLPLALLTGRVEYHFELSTPTGPGQANAGISFMGDAFGRDIDLNFLPEPLINKYSPVAVKASGEFNLLVETVKMKDGFPGDVTGKVVWKSAAILAPVEMIFGDTVMDIQSLAGELVGRIENNADFGVSGDVAITPGGEYRVDLLLSPDAGASQQAVLLLENTATVQADGKFRLRSTGQW